MAKPQVENFRHNVGVLCAAHGEIQRVADRSGITRVYLSKIIHGHATPSLDIALAIAEGLDFALAELMAPPRQFKKNLAKTA